MNLLHVMKCIFGILNSCCTMQNLTSECVYLELNLLDIVELFCQVIFPFLIRYIEDIPETVPFKLKIHAVF